MSKTLVKIFFLFSLIFLNVGIVKAQTFDFAIQNNTVIDYVTGNDYVTVSTEYIREVKNSAYYYSTQGEKIFHIPDLPQSKQYELELERQYKIDSLKVTENNGRAIQYTTEELEDGQGIYVKVPNYKQTTYSSPYKVIVEYKTHDLVKKILNYVVIVAPALHEDTEFQQVDSGSGTKTSFTYDLKIRTDKNLPPLAKIYPDKYTIQDEENNISYLFDSEDRISNSPYLEFGTNLIYKFELKYKTPKTDMFVPEKYSSVLNAISTNIYELSLPREFSETNQRVKIESIYPTPTKIVKDNEGNIIAKFEVPANKSSELSITGYITVQQDAIEQRKAIPNLTLEEYKEAISKDSDLKKYLTSSIYWESTDSYIVEEAEKLLVDTNTILDVIRNDYRYINDRLEYDVTKANSDNERIGARAALLGGGSVCMEYADSMIALLRAQGIASRAALGYSNLNVLGKTNEEGSTRHQWVQVWIPDYGWLSIDPTYESENMLIGQNMEKILWETFYNEELTNIKIYSADKIGDDDFSEYTVKIYAVEDIPNIDALQDYSEIKAVDDVQTNTVDILNTFIKTTALGKSLIIILPVFVILFALLAVSIFITSLIRRFRTRKVS